MLEFEDRATFSPLARCLVDLRMLEVDSPIQGTFPVTLASSTGPGSGASCGSCQVWLHVEFGQQLTTYKLPAASSEAPPAGPAEELHSPFQVFDLFEVLHARIHRCVWIHMDAWDPGS